MRRFISELKPTCFDDVISASSLFRPGPLDAIEDGKTMVQHFVDRKHGKERVEFDHPLLEPVLRDTYGVIVYQEQVMRGAGVGGILARTGRYSARRDGQKE